MKLFRILLLYTLVSLYWFIKSEDNQIKVSFDKLFPSNTIEKFYKLLSNKFADLRQVNQKSDHSLFFSELIDSILDFHIYIFAIKQATKKDEKIYKEDLNNILYFINLMNSNIEKAFKEDSNKAVTKVLLDKAIVRLSALT